MPSARRRNGVEDQKSNLSDMKCIRNYWQSVLMRPWSGIEPESTLRLHLRARAIKSLKTV